MRKLNWLLLVSLGLLVKLIRELAEEHLFILDAAETRSTIE